MRFFMKRGKEKSVKGRGHSMSLYESLERMPLIQGGKAPRGRSRQRSMVDKVPKSKEERPLSREQLPELRRSPVSENLNALDLTKSHVENVSSENGSGVARFQKNEQLVRDRVRQMIQKMLSRVEMELKHGGYCSHRKQNKAKFLCLFYYNCCGYHRFGWRGQVTFLGRKEEAH